MSGVTNLSNNAAPLAIAAAGESLVVISKGFDLSVAGVVSLSNVLMATYPVDGPGGALVSLLICLGVGGAIGVLNGILVAILRLQSIAATLGTMIMGQGLALVIMDAPGGTIADWVSYTLTDVLFGIIPISGPHRAGGRGLVACLPPHRHLHRPLCGRRGRNGGFAVGDFGRARALCRLRRRGPALWTRGLHAERADRDRQSQRGNPVPHADLRRRGARRRLADRRQRQPRRRQ